LGTTKKAVRRTRQALELVAPALGLLRSCLSDSSTNLWIGDSHSVFLTRSWPVSSRLTKIEDHTFVWHAGPRLMWSIAHNGFPADVRLVAQLIRWFGGSRSLSLVVVFGEIDVRVHLAGTRRKSQRSMQFVSEYVTRCQHLGQKLCASRVFITVPVPPGDSFVETPGFPRSGTLAERINAFQNLRLALEAALHSTETEPTTVMLDFSEELADSDGSLRGDLTDDGCHVNDRGARLVGETLSALSTRSSL
jgi:hypothetical protein